MARHWGLALSLSLISAWPAIAAAHPVTVDGSAADWFGVAGNGFNVGRVARRPGDLGEFFWVDEAADTRTDLSGGGPETGTDILSVRATATPTALCMLIQSGASMLPGAVPQVQIAIDLDRITGVGQTFFGGFGDTVVAEDARWEFLLQTQAGGGVPRVDLLNTAFSRTMGAATAAIGAGGLELCLPWSQMMRVGPPVAMRLTIATFRENLVTGNTIDIGGPSGSNALDVVTDYVDQPSFSQNTFAEVSDGVVNHHIELWFEPDGDVMSPLLVSRFMAAPASAGEWIQLRNATTVTLLLDNFKVGDEETPGAGEGMRRIPAGTMLAAGAAIIVAESAGNFMTRYGAPADFTFTGLLAFSGWATGGIGLNNMGDEVVVLGADNTVIDVAVSGIGIYPGVTAMAAPPSDAVGVRAPPLLDTDNCAVDFQYQPACAPATGCGACAMCLEFSCRPQPAGTSCADADLCDGSEACDGSGLCADGPPIVCDDMNPCTQNSCVAATGCAFPPEPMGTACADADLCDGAEACDGAGMCAAGPPLVCTDTNPCTQNTCVPATGCAFPPEMAGTSCADADLCDGAEVCDASAMCLAATPLVCEDMNPCTANRCAVGTGCEFPPEPAGTACADTDMCDGAEACDGSGTCAAGMPLTCNDGDPCTMDGCAAATGCTTTMAPAGASCADEDLCNGDETCNAAGACVGGTMPDCDDLNPCSADSCDPDTGCEHTDVAEGTSCADGDPCNGDERCDDMGTCQPGTPIVCDDGGMMDGGTDAGDTDAGGSDAGDDAGSDAGGTDAGGGTDGARTDAGRDAGFMPPPPGADGCSCRVGTPPTAGALPLLLAALFLLVRRRRR